MRPNMGTNTKAHTRAGNHQASVALPGLATARGRRTAPLPEGKRNPRKGTLCGTRDMKLGSNLKSVQRGAKRRHFTASASTMR